MYWVFFILIIVRLGGFSRVYLVSHDGSDLMFAIKLLDKLFILKNKKEGIV